MRAAREAQTLKAVADIRRLQTRAAERDHVRADQARRSAGERLEEGRAAVREAERGWAAATGQANLDPVLARAWLYALGARRAAEDELEAAEAAAAREAAARLADLRLAQARADASKTQARRAARTVARRREESLLGAIEDQLNAKRRTA